MLMIVKISALTCAYTKLITIKIYLFTFIIYYLSVASSEAQICQKSKQLLSIC